METEAEEGLEPGAKSSRKTAFPERGGAECGALGAELALIDTELSEVVVGWAKLPEALRAGIVAMVREAKKARLNARGHDPCGKFLGLSLTCVGR